MLSILGLYQALIIPIGLSLFLSYLLAPVSDWLQKFHLSRLLSASILIFCTLAITIFIFIRLLPPLYFEILDLVSRAPSSFNYLVQSWVPTIRDFFLSKNLMSAEEFNDMINNLGAVNKFSKRIYEALQTLWVTAPRVLGTMINIVLVPLLTFFILKERDNIAFQFNKLIPKDLRRPAHNTYKELSITLRAVIKGQATVASILAILYVVGLSIIGLPSALAIGLVSGLCRLIPYLDVIVGGFFLVLLLLLLIFKKQVKSFM